MELFARQSPDGNARDKFAASHFLFFTWHTIAERLPGRESKSKAPHNHVAIGHRGCKVRGRRASVYIVVNIVSALTRSAHSKKARGRGAILPRLGGLLLSKEVLTTVVARRRGAGIVM